MDLPDDPSPRPPAASFRILVVDGALPVLHALAAFLRSFESLHPFEIEVATTGAKALVRLGHLPGIEAVICNLTLPDLDGRSLYRQACARSPDLRGRFVFLTGERFSSSPPHEVDGSTVISLPFDPKLLLSVLRELPIRHPPRADA